MAETTAPSPTYHALLIGISAYPPKYNSLLGCVNDIDAIEQLLLDPPGIGVPAEQIRVIRLAAPREGTLSSTRYEHETRFPSKPNVVAALQTLAGSDVKETDRVLIYYSGHGHFEQRPNAPTHEMLALNGGDDIQFLYDVELNHYLAAIAARTNDLTVVLDCCHSGGATRAIQTGEPAGAARFLRRVDGQRLQPAPAVPDLPFANQGPTTGMLGALDPTYITLVACQADEKAHEGPYENGRSQGALTLSLLRQLGSLDADSRMHSRWADIFPRLLESVSSECASLKQASQYPSLIGRSERRIFGGTWKRQDPGFAVSSLPNGQYSVDAGTLMGVSRNAQLAAYGTEPAEFPVLGSQADLKARIGMLLVVSAERATSTAQAMGAAFDPTGARSRLVIPGESYRLRVLVEDLDPSLSELLGKSTLLRVVTADASEIEASVARRPDGGWAIGNDTSAVLAIVPPHEMQALCAGLESYHRFSTVLRLARNSNDPELTNVLSVRLLDGNDPDKLRHLDTMNPDLAEIPRDVDGIYYIPAGDQFCIEVRITYRPLSKSILDQNLHVTVFDCSAGGAAQYLGDATLVWHLAEMQGDRQLVWQLNEIGTPFTATPDLNFENGGTDRIVAVATTRHDVNLRGLEELKTVQEIIDDVVGAKGVLRGARTPTAPTELWTAITVPLRIGAKK